MSTQLAITDEQREALYSAESLVWWGRRFRTIEEAQAYVDDVVAAPFWATRNRRVEIRVIASDGERGHVHFDGGAVYMTLPPHAMVERYVLHELAHVLTYDARESYHGPIFARTYLALVAARLGRDHARTMRRFYLAHGVRW